ncbi:hypothetical protein Tco_1398634, partial [Tanacetum coccineum]
DIHGVGYEDDFVITTQASSSTEDAINQLCSKSPMSKTEVPSDITSTDKQCNSEFPNGHTYVPSPSDDQDYVEYPLQHVEGFPCNIEYEERMLMEAVLLSLKDLEPKQPKEEPPVSDSKSPVTNHIAPIKTDTTTRDSTASSSESPSQFMSPCNSTSSAEQSSSMTPSAVSSSDTDMVDRTKATVTVEKTPSSNIMDGLLRRWDLNFFKNR